MTVATPDDTDTIAHSREWLDENRGEGVSCPSCDQLVKVYRRKINAGMARTLITMYHKGGTQGFVHTPSLPGDTHEASQLSWWGFIEEEKMLREDGGRAGHWRVTPEGEDWLLGRTKAAKYAFIYNGKLLNLDDEESVLITDSLGTKFNYNELMSA